MGFLKNLFKRKPGGTMVGNLIRGAVKAVPVVGSLFGNGAMMITPVDADKRDLSDQDFEAKYGATKDNVKSDGSVIAYLRETLGAAAYGAVQGVHNYQAAQGNNLPANGGFVSGAKKSAIMQYLPYILGGSIGLIGLLFFIFKRK